MINDFALAKDLYKRDSCCARDDGWWTRNVRGSNGHAKGIVNTDGKLWQEQRRFALQKLRDFGFGNRGLDGVIQDEAEDLVKSLLHGSYNVASEVND